MKDETQNFLVRDIPVPLMNKLKKLAENERRSISQQIIYVLEKEFKMRK